MHKTLQKTIVICLAVLGTACKWVDPNRGPSLYCQMKLIVSDPIVSPDADELKLSDDYVKFLGLTRMSDNKIKKIIIINPTLTRLDRTQNTDNLATKLTEDVGNSEFNQVKTGKIITENLKSHVLPKIFGHTRANDSILNASLLLVVNNRAKQQRLFFFKANSNDSTYQTGAEKFVLFQNLDTLKKAIIDSICVDNKIQPIVVINPPSSAPGSTEIKIAPPKKVTIPKPPIVRPSPPANTPAGYVCDYRTHTRYRRLHDGHGKYKRGQVVQEQCPACGANRQPYNTVLPGYICDKNNKYQMIANGKGGFFKGTLIETDCKDCNGQSATGNIDPSWQKINQKYLNNLKSNVTPANNN